MTQNLEHCVGSVLESHITQMPVQISLPSIWRLQ